MSIQLGRSKARDILRKLDVMESDGEITAQEKQVLNSRIRRSLRERPADSTSVRISSYSLDWTPDA
jgi:hypothetical protein